MTHISVVIPVFNAEDCLHELYRRVIVSLETVSKDFEIIMIEDSGYDRSWDIIVELSKRDKRVRGIQLARNFGQHNALLCGIRAARGEVIVTLDDDLQHPPEEIPKLLEKLGEGYDVVYGTAQKEHHGFWRHIASRITRLVLRSAMGPDIARYVTAFRAFRTQIREAFINYQGSFISIDVLLSWGTKRFGALTVGHDPRRAGVSNYTFRRLVTQALNMLTGFSTLPLQLASLIGFGFTLFGFGVLAYVLGTLLPTVR